MNMRIGLLFLVVLGAGWASAARQIAHIELSDRSVVIFDTQLPKKDNQASDKFIGNNQVCTLCEEFTEQALNYVAENKTQTEIIGILHTACSQVPSFKQQVSSMQPEQFCQKINLCKKIAYVSSKFQEDKCGVCHRAVSEVLIKLKDPDTQLEILELLLKGCDSMDNYSAKCKRMVFEYGPIILTNAEQFLETKDICTMLHACDTSKANGGEAVTALKADS